MATDVALPAFPSLLYYTTPFSSHPKEACYTRWAGRNDKASGGTCILLLFLRGCTITGQKSIRAYVLLGSCMEGRMLPYDFVTTEKRSNTMKRIRGRDTKPEVLLAKTLWRRGIRYRKNYALLPGKPDIAITKYKIAIFVDGEFWHGYNWESKKERIKANRDYWIRKIEGNMERDKVNNIKLEQSGWIVLRFWANEVEEDLDGCLHAVERAIESRK